MNKIDPRDSVSTEALNHCIEWNVREAHRAKDPKDSERYQNNAIEVANYLKSRVK